MESYVHYLKSKGKFTAWLVVLLVLLIMIPLVISLKLNTMGKVLGIVLVVSFSIALYIWRSRMSANAILKKRIPITINDRFWLNEHIPFYRVLSKSDKKIFEDRMALFLAEIIITDVSKEVPDKSDCFYVAASAIIAYWGLPYWNYGNLQEVLIYPDNFDFEKKVSASGNILGMVHHGGLMDRTMILSKRALVNGFIKASDGRNVGIHEFTHLIDKADGSIEGLPVGLSAEERMNWLKVFKAELEKPNFTLDDYAKTNTSEFYAVAAEMFKENPDKLQKGHPELYDILKSYYSKVG